MKENANGRSRASGKLPPYAARKAIPYAGAPQIQDAEDLEAGW
jgi:hypothetical protein